jgi:hypothetical protein
MEAIVIYGVFKVRMSERLMLLKKTRGGDMKLAPLEL